MRLQNMDTKDHEEDAVVMNAPPDSDLSRIAKSDGFKQHGTAGTSLGGDVSGTGPRYSELKGSSPKSDDPDVRLHPGFAAGTA